MKKGLYRVYIIFIHNVHLNYVDSLPKTMWSVINEYFVSCNIVFRHATYRQIPSKGPVVVGLRKELQVQLEFPLNRCGVGPTRCQRLRLRISRASEMSEQ